MTLSKRMASVAEAWERNRDDLLRFVRRLVIRPEIAEELVQQTAQRALAATRAPAEATELRPWLFRIASNLAIDELRRMEAWPETALLDARATAENDESFVAASMAMQGTPEMASIAREHLAFCYSCTLRSLPPHQAAALLLVEVYAFTVKEAAEILEASFGQIKNWLQTARADLNRRYQHLCALVNKQGVCYQCSELSSFFNGNAENPLAGSAGKTADRARVVRTADGHGLSTWHRRLVSIIEERRRRAR